MFNVNQNVIPGASVAKPAGGDGGIQWNSNGTLAGTQTASPFGGLSYSEHTDPHPTDNLTWACTSPFLNTGVSATFGTGCSGNLTLCDTPAHQATLQTASSNGLQVISNSPGGKVRFFTQNGEVHIDPTGNVLVKHLGAGLQVAEGANGMQGVVTLVGGAATVNNVNVLSTSRIILTGQEDGGTPGWQRVSSRIANTSFTITSSSVLDTSVVGYQIFQIPDE